MRVGSTKPLGTGPLLTAAKIRGLHTAIETFGYLGDRADDSYLTNLDLILLNIKSSAPDTHRNLTGWELAPTLHFAKRLAANGKRIWLRFTPVPGYTDDPANVDGITRFVVPMNNVERVEVQSFHQLGAYKREALNYGYGHANTPTPTPGLIHRVFGQFQAVGSTPADRKGELSAHRCPCARVR